MLSTSAWRLVWALLLGVHVELGDAAPAGSPHLGTFPPALHRLAAAHGVRRLELSLTQGHWVYGPPPPEPLPPAPPPGLELRVQFGRSVNDTYAAFGAVTRALGGALCSALGMVLEEGVLAAPRAGWFGRRAVASGRQIYAFLPQQALCSESLGAWQRLAPCRGEAGLAAALPAAAFAAAPYRSLGLRLTAAGGAVCLRQSLTAVLDGARGAAAQQQLAVRRAVPACPAASSAAAYLPPPRPQQAAAGCKLVETVAGQLQVCDTSQLARVWPLPGSRDSGSSGAAHPPAGGWQPGLLRVERHVISTGGTSGELVLAARVAAPPLPRGLAATCAAAGEGARSGALLHVMQLLPWQLPAVEGSLRVALDGRELSLGGPEVTWASLPLHLQRRRGSLGAALELLLNLPAGSGGGGEGEQEVVVSLRFRKAFLSVFDQPPDASRGVDLPPAIVTLIPGPCDTSSHGDGSARGGSSARAAGGSLLAVLALTRGDDAGHCGPARAYSGGAVVRLPIPDASMPFNVICFASTLLAVYFGGMVNTMREPRASGAAGAARRTLRRKLARAALLAVLVGSLAVFLDKELQAQVDGCIQQAQGVLRHLRRVQSPQEHGELAPAPTR
eukprot:scaffold6.g2606.t1